MLPAFVPAGRDALCAAPRRADHTLDGVRARLGRHAHAAPARQAPLAAQAALPAVREFVTYRVPRPVDGS